MNEWYYVYKDKQMGPFNSYEFDLLVLKGEVRNDTLVWNSTMSDWQRFDSVQYRPPVPELKKTEIKENREIRSNLKSYGNTQTLPPLIKFLGVLVILFTIHRVYLLYGDFIYFKFILQGMIPGYYVIFVIISLITTGFWIVSYKRFRERDKRFLSTFRKTALLSCLPIAVSFIMHGNISYLFRFHPNNIGLIYLIIAVISFTLLKEEKFRDYFKS